MYASQLGTLELEVLNYASGKVIALNAPLNAQIFCHEFMDTGSPQNSECILAQLHAR